MNESGWDRKPTRFAFVEALFRRGRKRPPAGAPSSTTSPENSSEFPSDSFVEIRPGLGSPAISFLVPVFRQSKYIRGALRSVLEQRGVAVEIIISDDASGDDTFSQAMAAVEEYLNENETRHRIVMRRGTTRLRRNHLPLLTEQAECDLVCQAHGDDYSHPDRAKILVELFDRDPQVNLATSEIHTIRANEPVEHHKVDTGSFQITKYDYDAIINVNSRELIGCAQAWKKSSVGHFQRLDFDLAPTSHDRILPFRASLTGDTVLVREKLVIRREHPGAWHNLMFNEPGTSGSFSWSLVKLSALSTMDRDLDQARTLCLIDEKTFETLKSRIADKRDEKLKLMLDGFAEQTRSGRQIAWVDEAALIKLKKSR